jgi:hypothetical protein
VESVLEDNAEEHAAFPVTMREGNAQMLLFNFHQKAYSIFFFS